MTRVFTLCAAALPLLLLSVAPAGADVKTRERTQIKFEGVLGRMVGMFGGRAARDGVVTTNAVRGDRKAEMTDATGRIVDLTEEKVYELDLKRRTYQVITFEELRRRMREAQERAAKEAAKGDQDAEAQAQQEKLAQEVDVDFDLRETGQTRTIAGHNAREVVMTVTVRPKGRTLEEGGGLVMTANNWMGPDLPAMKEIADFEMRYWKAIAPEAAGLSAEQMAAVMAMYPLLKNAMERMKTEGDKLEGTPLATTMVLESVRSKEQLAQQSQPSGGGGIGGMIAGRLMKREVQPRATVFTMTTETLEITPDVPEAELQIPAGFKERK